MNSVCIVVPCFNEEGNVRELFQRLQKVIKGLSKNDLGLDWEIVFVNDGSHDRTEDELEKIYNESNVVSVINLSKNYGHQAAILAGLEYSAADITITMDADLQHPPSLIPELLKRWKKGFDIVFTVRKKTDKEPHLKRLLSSGYYKIFNLLASTNLLEGTADYRLYSRRALNAVLLHKEKSLFLRGIVSEIGFQQTYVEYVAPERFTGDSSYTMRKMIRLARDGITSFSNKPLRLASYFGMGLAFCSMVYVVFALTQFLVNDEVVPGWSSITAGIFFMGGVQLIFIGIIGEYIGQIFIEVKERPRYTTKEVLLRKKGL